MVFYPEVIFSYGVPLSRIIQHLGPEVVLTQTTGAIGTPDPIDITQTLSVTDLPIYRPGFLVFDVSAGNGAMRPPMTYYVADLSSLDARLAITYTYTPAKTAVPEPASLSLLGAGLLGLVVARRRRKAP